MRPSLIALLLGVLFISIPVWADNMSTSTDDSIFGREFTVHKTAGDGLGYADFGLDGRVFNSGDKSNGSFDLDNCFDSVPYNSSKRPQLSFVPKWGFDDHSDHDHLGDFNGWRWDHYKMEGEGKPTLPTPEPESLWLLLTGAAVIGLCAFLRRTLPSSKLEA